MFELFLRLHSPLWLWILQRRPVWIRDDFRGDARADDALGFALRASKRIRLLLLPFGHTEEKTSGDGGTDHSERERLFPPALAKLGVRITNVGGLDAGSSTQWRTHGGRYDRRR